MNYYKTASGYVYFSHLNDRDDHTEHEESISKAEFTRLKIQQEKAWLHKHLASGSTVHTCLRACSVSGMTRRLSCHAVIDGEIRDITYSVSWVLDRKPCPEYRGNRALIVKGCGMDMGFHVVNSLSYALGSIKEPYKLYHRWI